MAETFSLSELVIPGTYIGVRAEGLISVGGVSTGNIGIVGTGVPIQQIDESGNPILDDEGNPVLAVPSGTVLLSDYETAKLTFGMYDAASNGTGTANLTRGLEILFSNGARTVYARALAVGDGANNAKYTEAFQELLKDDVNILVAPELATDAVKAVLNSIVDQAENEGKDIIAVYGSNGTTLDTIKGQVQANKRLIMVTPGIMAFDAVLGRMVELSGTYSAAAVAGKLSTLRPQDSPTNKVLSGVTQLARRFSYGETKDLLGANVLVLEQREGVRVVRGLTTEGEAFKQITTRRITNFAKAGIRKASNPFIGRLNNQRVRKALQGAIDGFLTTMVQDEALISYDLEVTATRQDEIAGRAVVNATLRPTFSIDFVAVTMVLE